MVPLPPMPVDPDVQKLAARMRARRAERGLTFEELAERTGMSRRGVIDYEHGRTNGTLRHWFRIAVALEIPFSEFVKILD